MATPNMKQFTAAVCNPRIKALECLYRGQLAYMEKLVAQQNRTIDAANAEHARLLAIIADNQEQVLAYQKEVIAMRDNLYSSSQVKTLDRRMQELNYIAGTLYQKYWELANSGKVDASDLPSFTDPWIPGDYVKTEAELEADWRQSHMLSEDATLTEVQKSELSIYINKYYSSHYPRPAQSSGPDIPPPTPSAEDVEDLGYPED